MCLTQIAPCCRTDWEPEMVAKAEILRLIYQGRFLHCNVTLGALGLPMGKTTVMHLVPRDNLPEPNSQGKNTTDALLLNQPFRANHKSNPPTQNRSATKEQRRIE